MSIRLVRGPAAMELLADAEFQRCWDELRSRCPWATVFQSPAFVAAWYRVYQTRFEAVLLLERDASDGLLGLLPLAVANDATSRDGWVVAGAQQAEYQAWLADTEAAPDFIEEALGRLWQQSRPRRLTFRYLPAGAPIDWVGGGRFAALGQIEAFPCPLMELGDGTNAARSLAKRGNRSRLKRLARNGPLSYERITEPAAFRAILDDFAADCDFRHGAAHGRLPFHDDPQKRDFLLALFEQPGLLDVTVTRSGDTMLGAHVGLRDPDRMYNGMLVHSPLEARNSPGKLHVLQLAQDLARRGCRVFDLTPGNDPWKERFANRHETVHTLTLHGSAAACAAHRGGRALWGLGRETLRALGAEPRSVKQALLARLLTREPLPAAAHVIASAALADLRPAVLGARPRADGVTRNAVADLLLHAADCQRPRTAFLSDSLARLERGGACYSLVKDGRLVHLLWLTPGLGGAELAIEETVHLRDSLAPDERRGVLCHAIAEAVAVGPGSGRLVFKAPGATADDVAALRVLGFTASRPGA